MPAYPNIKLINAPRAAVMRMDYSAYRKMVVILRAVNHKLRQQIIRLLEDKKELTVTEIYIAMRLEQSVASQHLAFLRRAGVVLTTRKGKFMYYKLNEDRLKEIGQIVESLTEKNG